MRIDKFDVISILIEKGVRELYHANTLLTSIQYIKRAGLLSRAYAEANNIPQTSQWSDASDKKFRIWNDVFLDTVDIHARASKGNDYGPVLFVFDVNVLKLKAVDGIWITKCNPYKWEGMAKNERWFSSKKDLEDGLRIGDFGHSIVIRFCGRLPLRRYLKFIILDDPLVEEDGMCYHKRARKAIKTQLESLNTRVPIKKRICSGSCKCINQYHAWNCERATEMFRLE